MLPLAFGVGMDERSCAAVEVATGVRPDVVRTMQLSFYEGVVLDLADVCAGGEVALRRVALREWADFYGSRACPACLEELGGVWPLRWKLGWAAVCPVHWGRAGPRCRKRAMSGAATAPRQYVGPDQRHTPWISVSATGSPAYPMNIFSYRECCWS
ncbi:TniQ family protein [Streptosporangium roseum]|uniref:TniQ family protein n=1 Tax=Streptosporangium roseum TaxID=2001 RepID=UPI003333B014